MGNQNEGVFVLLQESGEPDDVLVVKIVGGLVQNKDGRVFQKKLDQQNLGSLSAGKVGYILVKSDVSKAEASGHFFDLCIQLIKSAVLQNLLDFSRIFHHFVHCFVRFGTCHILIKLEHFCLQLIHVVESGPQHLSYGSAFFQHRMLVQIANRYMAGPGDITLVGHDFSCNYIQKGGLAFTVGSDKPDVLAFKQAKRRVFQNLARAETVGYFFNCK